MKKYGIRLPNPVKGAYLLDKENNNNLWRKTIEEEMTKLNTAVAELKTSPKNLVGYEDIYIHMIFDIKLGENLRRKDRLSTGPHKTKAPSSITYS